MENQASQTSIQLIPLAQITTEGLQTRAELRQSTVAEYASRISDGEEFDPIVLFREGDVLWLAAGFHRLAAYREAGRNEIPCQVHEGTSWDAVQYGIQDNLQHRGERPNNRDKVHAIRLVLRMQPGLSDVAIASLCGVTDKTVRKYRVEMESTSEIPRLPTRTGLDGRTRAVPLPHDASRSESPLEPALLKAATNLHRCPRCGGLGKNDGTGMRSCMECKAVYPWDEHPLPDLIWGRSYRADGIHDDVVIIDPHPEQREYCFVAHYQQKASDQPFVVFGMRGYRRERLSIERLLKLWGFAPSQPWASQPGPQELPWYLPTGPERWAVEEQFRDTAPKYKQLPAEPSSPIQSLDCV